MASWLWGNETTEQAQIVVSALQSELDEREGKIQALEAALRREQQEFARVVGDEIQALEQRKARIEQELREVDALLQEKQRLLTGGGGKKDKASGKTKTKKKKTKDDGAAAVTAATTPTATATATSKTAAVAKSDAAATPKVAAAAAPAAGEPPAKPKALPMDEQLAKIAKVEPNVAFIIQRSTNANTVVYAAGRTADGQIDSAKPMDVYWIMYEKSGAPREDLNMIERNTAYGVTCAPSKTTRGEFAASLASLKDRDCVLLVDAHGNVQARTTINGKKGMVLRRVYVQMTSSWGLPTVDYVEIFGVDPQTHAPVYEKKLNK